MMARQVHVGQAVQANDLVAELDPQPLRDALRSAKANLAAARRSPRSHQQLGAPADAGGQGLVHRSPVRFRGEGVPDRQGPGRCASRPGADAEDKLGYTQLVADAAGVVISTGAEAGEVVRAGQTIVTVAQHDGVDAVFDVPADLIRRSHRTCLITISLTTIQNPTTGQVREASPQADPVTRSFRVKVASDQWPEVHAAGRDGVRAGAYGGENGIELPATALTIADNKPALWVVDPKSMQVSLRPVTVTARRSSSIVVSRGLEGGELVVTAGVHALRPGQKVSLLKRAS